MTPVYAAPAGVDAGMPFPAAEGRGLKIAVIDSGVNARHPHIIAATHGVVLETDSGGGSAEDRLGHGTAVMAAIQEKAPAAEYFAVKLFWDSLRTTVPRLIAAVDWAIAHGMDIVNLSLGTPNLEHGRLFEALLERAAARGAILVAPTHSDERPMLPGILPGVVSAGVDWNLPRHAYRTGGEGQPRFFASGYPRPLAGRPPGGNLYGISFAAANLTGIVARALEGTQDRRFDTVHGLLAQEAHRIAAG